MTPTLSRLKKPFGTAKMVDLTAVRYLAWEDAFEVDFEDGLTFLEPHSTIRKANKISPKAEIERVEMDEECHEGFFVPRLYLPNLLVVSSFPGLAMCPHPNGQVICLSRCGCGRGADRGRQSTM